LLAQGLQYLLALRNRYIAPRAAGAASGHGFAGRSGGRSASRHGCRAFARQSVTAGCSFRSAADRGGVALLFWQESHSFV